MDTVRLNAGLPDRLVVRGGQDYLATRKGDAGVLVFGPYEERPAGRYRVEFDIGRADESQPLGDPVCFLIDVKANRGATAIAERWVLHSQVGRQVSSFTLEFELQERRELEYRVLTDGQSPLLVSRHVRITRLGEARRISSPLSSEQRAWRNEREFLDGYLRNVSGVIHVGANLGQERRYYWLIGLDVIWIEPIREVYEKLVDNITSYPRQRAINALLSARGGDQVEFRIANNDGASSSMLALEDHAVIFPDISYVEKRTLTTTTLTEIVSREAIPLDRYQALTLDVEGAEKLVLEGAAELLGRFDYVKCEVADFPARTGSPTVADLEAIVGAAGFTQLARRSFAQGPRIEGTYWDIVWKKVVPGREAHEAGYALPLVMNPSEVDGIEKI